MVDGLDEVPNLRGSAMRSWVGTIAPIIAALGMFGGFVWQASKYPTREEFDTVRASVIRIQVDQAVMSARQEARDKQGDRIEQSVKDLAAQAGRKPRER